MFDLVERSGRLSRNLRQTNPHPYGAGDAVAMGIAAVLPAIQL
ncbi:hypothetical protein [Verminephrobacter eiseniae]|nr:hypothetical protein [Verminephrobacter eiseniae]